MFPLMQRHASLRFTAIERVQQLPLCSPSVEGSEWRKIVTSVDGLAGDDGAAITGEKATTQAVSIRAPFSRMRFC
jgi:hypothetical protein